MKTDWKNVLSRAGWTAIQAFVGSIPTAAFIEAITEADLTTLETLAFAGIAAAGSSILSFIKTLSQERLAALSQKRIEEALGEAMAVSATAVSTYEAKHAYDGDV